VRRPTLVLVGRRPSRPPDARAILAANLRRLRARRRWSQERLGDEAGLHRTFIGSVERRERNISIDNVALLAWALDVSVGELLTDAS
jgi:transcriptional regulator with XRE-family HTH domain